MPDMPLNAELNRAETAARLAFGDFAVDADPVPKPLASSSRIQIPAAAVIALLLVTLGLLA